MRIEAILKQRVSSTPWNAVVTITPEQAKAILEHQPTQRPINQKAVDGYVAEMRAGRWQVTHQGLACDEKGLLFDGQHRLWACFLSGVPLVTAVFFNQPRVQFDVIDTGAPRTIAQLSVMKGHFSDGADANSGTAALRFLWAYDLGKNPTLAYKTPGFSAGVADDVLSAHPGISAALDNVGRARLRRFSLPRGASVALFTMFTEADEAVASEFMHEIATGQRLTDGDPALTLRNSGMQEGARKKPSARDMIYRLARAWNARVERRALKRLYGAVSPAGERGRSDGIDFFPEIIGYRRPGQRA
ncbi:hypothetical protein [Elioraea sp.]|uniref:hypothetical protein n=1 Tax=Elioraea sp. TaxID=2185103 RepID=UPI0025BBC987|nr:hypothetical protein [Elioraea sp.]